MKTKEEILNEPAPRVPSTSTVVNNIKDGAKQPPQELICLNCSKAVFRRTAERVVNFCKIKHLDVYDSKSTQPEDIILDCDGIYEPEPDAK